MVPTQWQGGQNEALAALAKDIRFLAVSAQQAGGKADNTGHDRSSFGALVAHALCVARFHPAGDPAAIDHHHGAGHRRYRDPRLNPGLEGVAELRAFLVDRPDAGDFSRLSQQHLVCPVLGSPHPVGRAAGGKPPPDGAGAGRGG